MLLGFLFQKSYAGQKVLGGVSETATLRKEHVEFENDLKVGDEECDSALRGEARDAVHGWTCSMARQVRD
jgi:hypothetical protein